MAVLAALIAPAGPALAGDDVTVSAALDAAVVRVGNDVVLTVTVQGKFRRSVDPQLPPLEDFDVYDAGTSQNFSMINGRIQSSISYRYTLVPKKEGDYTIGSVRFVIQDKEYSTKPMPLEVVAASGAITPQAASGSSQTGESTPVDKTGKERSIFIQAAVDRDTVYVNQQITWTLGYYSDGRVALMRSPNYTPPEAEGFWVEDLPPQNKYYTSLYNRQYLVNEIKRGYFPTSPGLFEIGPAKVDVVVDDLSANRLDDFFSRSFRSRGFGKAQTLATKTKKIAVLPLPRRGRPVDFSGVVAKDLTLSMSADKQVVQVGEPVNLSVVLNGLGNMKTVAPPELKGMESFKVYESGSHSDIFKKNYVVSGRKKYDYVVVPKNQGKHTILAVELSYFDPGRKQYLVARSHPVHLNVQPGTQEEGRKIIYAGAGDEFEVISQDIRFIHPVPATIAVSNRLTGYGGKVLLALHVLPFLAVMLSLAAEKRRRRFRDNVSLARASRALRDAHKKIGAAGKLFRGDETEGGYAAVSAAVFGYFADKMNVSAAGLTVDSLETFLREGGVGEDLVSATRKVIGACDAARFAAGGASADRGLEIAAEAHEVLRSIERGRR
jgi:hypothetical protein